jgi:hypothetical protein
MNIKPMTRPISGEVNSGTITLSQIFTQQTTLILPEETMAAPIRLPISACEELLGKARYHVIRFHTIAPNKAAAITCWSRDSFTMPDEIVSATLTLTSAPTKLSVADISIAALGVNTLVDTDVAIELAVS